MKKVIVLSLSLLIAAHFSMVVAQPLGPTQLIEKVEARDGKTVIPYSKYQLANGLTLMIHPNNTAPIVHVEVTYKVGSSRELPGRSGFAHFFEHMMFQGSEHVEDEEHFKIVQNAGGNMNGTTNRDRTNYYQTVPSNMLETMLWLESDRMGFLPNAFTEEKFEVQRKTVINEKNQNYGRPYGFVSEVKDQLLYPNGHPYSWPIIGFTEDLDRATRDDLNSFFLRYYGPNNAILAISGDVNEEEVVQLVEKYFGSIPEGPNVNKMRTPQFRLAESEYKTYTDNIFFPLTMVVYPTVPNYHRDEAPLDLLAQLMAGGRNSIFYRNFVKTEKAIDISVSHPAFELSGEFTITALAYPFVDTKTIREMIQSTIEEFEKEGFTDEDLERVKQGMMADFSSAFESNSSIAKQLTSFEMLLPGKSYNVQDEIDRYQKVTKQDIMRVFKQYIKNKNFACIMVERDPNLNTPGGKHTPYVSFNPHANVTPDYSEFEGLVYNRPVDDFDRSVKPTPPPAKPVIAPQFYNFKLNNGVNVLGSQDNRNNRVLFYINIDGGNLFEDGKKVPFGTAFLTAAMLNESTQKYPAADLENALESIGSSISFSSSGSSITGVVRCFKDQIPKTMELLEQMLLFPNFETEDFNLLKKRLEENVANQRTSQNIIASKMMSRLIYGDKSPLGKYYTGNYDDFRKIKLNHVVDYYNQFVSAEHMKIVVVGNTDENELKKNLSFLNSFDNKMKSIPEFADFPSYNKTQVFMCNKPNTPNSQIMIGHRAMPFDAYGDFFHANIMNFALGGNFNSRLNLTIREDKGWTYGIFSYFASAKNNIPGYFGISSSIKSEATDSAITEIMSILNEYYEKGITEEELEFTKSALISSEALRYETSFDVAGFLLGIISRNLEPNYKVKQAEIIRNLTVEQVNSFIKSSLKPENLIVVVVGDESKIKPKLENLGLGKIQMLDTNAEGKVKVFKK